MVRLNEGEQSLKQRIITGIIGGTGFIWLLWLGGPWYAALVYLLAFAAFFEYVRMRSSQWQMLFTAVGFLFIAAFLSLTFSAYTWMVLIWSVLFVFLFITVASKNKISVVDIGYYFIGLLYISIGFHFMIDVRLHSGLEWTLLAVSLVWSTDTGAYFSGLLFGRHKLWPAISPKKTIEGSIGGTLLAMVVAVLFYVFGNEITHIWAALTIGFVVAVVAQIGDFIESAIKRTFAVKDSGKILPGHGGVLDRFDSMIAVFPVVGFLIVLFG